MHVYPLVLKKGCVDSRERLVALQTPLRLVSKAERVILSKTQIEIWNNAICKSQKAAIMDLKSKVVGGTYAPSCSLSFTSAFLRTDEAKRKNKQ